ncbi:MAG: lipoprotein LenA [Leptonema sp. (in: Bacteria)]|nr:lipoprotein LenA [Leptonema sp. (in: bacteria)]
MLQTKLFKSTTTILIGLSFAIFAFSCGNKNTEEESESNNEILFSRYPVAIYKVAGSVAAGDWVATLAKAERVKIVSRQTLETEKGPAPYVEVSAAGNKVGFAAESAFAKEVGVIVVTDPKLFQRPVITSPAGYNSKYAETGIVVFIESQADEQETWYEITGSNQGQYFKGYVLASDVSFEPHLINEAVLLENAITKLKSKKGNSTKEGLQVLEELTSSSEPMIANLAEKIITEHQNKEGQSESKFEDSPEATAQ